MEEELKKIKEEMYGETMDECRRQLYEEEVVKFINDIKNPTEAMFKWFDNNAEMKEWKKMKYANYHGPYREWYWDIHFVISNRDKYLKKIMNLNKK